MPRINILDCPFDHLDTTQTLNNIEKLISHDGHGYLCTVNVSILIMMRGNHRLANFVNNATMIVADGQPIVWTSKFFGQSLPERVTGVDLVYHLAEMAEKNEWGIYLLGATIPILGKLGERLITRYPNLIISGFGDGYFDLNSAGPRVKQIRDSNAKILIVAMGVPRQEYFIEEQFKNCGVNFAVGVGGSFDVLSEEVSRAPSWMQNSGLEWLYRTIQEPRRLFWRYAKTNSQFIALLLKEFLFRMVRKK